MDNNEQEQPPSTWVPDKPLDSDPLSEILPDALDALQRRFDVAHGHDQAALEQELTELIATKAALDPDAEDFLDRKGEIATRIIEINKALRRRSQ